MGWEKRTGGGRGGMGVEEEREWVGEERGLGEEE